MTRTHMTGTHDTAHLTRRIAAFVGTIAALGLTACGGGDDAGDTASAEEIAAAFVEQGAPEDEANCVAEQIEGELSLGDVEAFVDADDPEDVDAAVLEAIGAALVDCTG